jgi:hypothetical protein
MEHRFQPFGVDGEAIHQRAFARAFAQAFVEREGEQQRSDDGRSNQTVCEAWYEAEQLVDGSLVNIFRQPLQEYVTEQMNSHAGADCDQKKG